MSTVVEPDMLAIDRASIREAIVPGAATKSALALILAGGRGSRLEQLTDWRAKPAVPFGGKFRIIDFALSNCVNSGMRRIGVCTQYKAQSLIRHVQRGWSFLDGRFDEFVELLPAQQRIVPSWYKGTADAVYQNIDILRRLAPRCTRIELRHLIKARDTVRVLRAMGSETAMERSWLRAGPTSGWRRPHWRARSGPSCPPACAGCCNGCN